MPSVLFFQLLLLQLPSLPFHPFFDLHFTNYTAISVHFTSENRRALCRQYVYRVVCALCVCVCVCALCFVCSLSMNGYVYIGNPFGDGVKTNTQKPKHWSKANRQPQTRVNHDSKEVRKNEKPTTTTATTTIQITLTECCIRTKRNGDMQARTFHTHSHSHTHAMLQHVHISIALY